MNTARWTVFMYPSSCALYTVQCTLYSVQCNCTVYTSGQRLIVYYVRRLGGYINTARWVDEQAAVRKILTRLWWLMMTGTFRIIYWQGQFALVTKAIKIFPLHRIYRVGYDAPVKFWNRRNKVWFCQSCWISILSVILLWNVSINFHPWYFPYLAIHIWK